MYSILWKDPTALRSLIMQTIQNFSPAGEILFFPKAENLLQNPFGECILYK